MAIVLPVNIMCVFTKKNIMCGKLITPLHINRYMNIVSMLMINKRRYYVFINYIK